jgi:hypothetical protein
MPPRRRQPQQPPQGRPNHLRRRRCRRLSTRRWVRQRQLLLPAGHAGAARLPLLPLLLLPGAAQLLPLRRRRLCQRPL